MYDKEVKKNKFIQSGTEDSYYGIERKWLVKQMNPKELFKFTESVERREVLSLDFGKPTDDTRRYNEFLGLHYFDIKDVIETITDSTMESGTRGNIVEEVIKNFYDNYVLDVIYTSYTKASAWHSHCRMEVHKKDGNIWKEEDLATVEEIKEYLSEEERNVTAEMDCFGYHTSKNSYYGEKAIEYLVNKMLKEKYTYCVKCGKNIVPDEYLKEGAAGIQRWKSEKSSSNKQNSVEKQVLKQIKREKRKIAYSKFFDCMQEISKGGSYDMVHMNVDGQWNKSRTDKTIRKYILTGGEDELVTISEEEIEKRCKSYWVYELEQLIEKIKKIEFKQR